MANVMEYILTVSVHANLQFCLFSDGWTPSELVRRLVSPSLKGCFTCIQCYVIINQVHMSKINEKRFSNDVCYFPLSVPNLELLLCLPTAEVGWWVGHPKSKLTQPRSATTCLTLHRLIHPLVRQVLKMRIKAVPLPVRLLLWLITAPAGPSNLSKIVHQNIINEWMNSAVLLL